MLLLFLLLTLLDFLHGHIICEQTHFYICMPFISFSCLIALAKTSSMMWKRSGERDLPCFVHDLSESVWNLFVVRAKLISSGLKQTEDFLAKLLEVSELIGE